MLGQGLVKFWALSLCFSRHTDSFLGRRQAGGCKPVQGWEEKECVQTFSPILSDSLNLCLPVLTFFLPVLIFFDSINFVSEFISLFDSLNFYLTVSICAGLVNAMFVFQSEFMTIGMFFVRVFFSTFVWQYVSIFVRLSRTPDSLHRFISLRQGNPKLKAF